MWFRLGKPLVTQLVKHQQADRMPLIGVGPGVNYYEYRLDGRRLEFVFIDLTLVPQYYSEGNGVIERILGLPLLYIFLLAMNANLKCAYSTRLSYLKHR